MDIRLQATALSITFGVSKPLQFPSRKVNSDKYNHLWYWSFLEAHNGDRGQDGLFPY